MSARALLLYVSLLAAAAAQAASFDCAKASSQVEHLICDDPKLSELDSKLGQAYQEVLSKATDEQKQSLIADQRHWLKFTRNPCGEATCLKHAYWSRQAALETFFAPKSPLYPHESDKAEAIKQIVATAPLFPLLDTPFCRQIFDDMKSMNGIRLVDPIVQTQSYEDPALDHWKKACRSAPPFNTAFECLPDIGDANADDVVAICQVGYGLPPFKLYELAPIEGSDERRYFFYADENYGPMNRSEWRKPSFGGGGLAGFAQVHLTRCLSNAGNYWEQDGEERAQWQSTGIRISPIRNGKNYNSIIEYQGQYYFLMLYEGAGNYWLDIKPTAHSDRRICNWTPVKQ